MIVLCFLKIFEFEIVTYNRIFVLDLLIRAVEDDGSEFISVQCLASSIVEASVADGTGDEKEEVSELMDGEKLKILANGRNILDSIGMMTEGGERQIGRAQSVMCFQKTKDMRQRCIKAF